MANPAAKESDFYPSLRGIDTGSPPFGFAYSEQFIGDTSQLVKDLMHVETSAFSNPAHRLTTKELRRDLAIPRSILMLLRDGNNGGIIGFAHSIPYPRYLAQFVEPESYKNIPRPELTAHLNEIAIMKEFKHKHLDILLMESLEQELKQKGNKYISLTAEKENGSAQKVERHYRNRILFAHDHVHPQFGPQTFSWIKL